MSSVGFIKELPDLYDEKLHHSDERIFLLSHAYFIAQGFIVWNGSEVKTNGEKFYLFFSFLSIISKGKQFFVYEKSIDKSLLIPYKRDE